uniref:Tensin 2b n=1 Tax=Scophthalmus maximus TaxID=52904 RepID=A0A8D3DDB3_SCOMX
MHYSKISAGADQALTTLAMRKFCEDKVSSSLQPSQNRSDTLMHLNISSSPTYHYLRLLPPSSPSLSAVIASHHFLNLFFPPRYVYYFSGLLSGTIKMNSSPLFLHQILIPSLPNFQTGGGFYPFLKIYQSLQLVYTSGVYDPQSSRARKLCVTVEPALLLKGDIMVKCYHRRSRAAEREVVFRVQFHTCTVHGAQLWFGKTELDLACADDRFPPDATVEFIFSNGPEKMKGREYRKNDASIKVDYDTSDHVVRWDSYENFNLHHQDSFENISHTRGPLDGSLYAQVRKRRGPGSTASAASPNGCLTSSPTVKPLSPTYSNSSCPSPPTGHLQDASASTNCPERENTDCAPRGGDGEDRAREKTRGKEKDRETAILDDGELFSPGGLRREHSCCGRASTKCANAGWERERAPCLSNGRCLGRCNSIKNHPKSQTLPALPSKSVSSPPNVAHMELCHRHSANPLPELPWEHPPPPLPPPCPVSTGHTTLILPLSTHTHTATPSQPPTDSAVRRSVTSSIIPTTARPHTSPINHCPPALTGKCSSALQHRPLVAPVGSAPADEEHQSDSVRTFHPLHPDQTENPHWSQGAGVQQREAPPLWESENPWEVVRDAEFWQCKSATPAFRVCHSSLDQVPNLEQPRFAIAPHQSYHSPQSLLDVRDGASSGYHTPPPPRHSCPCSPHQSSPAESHESRGYASGYHSGSASPLPASSPSTGRGRLPETPSKSREQQNAEVEKAKTDVEDDISQGSEVKSDSGGQSITPGLDSDHDYTIIGSSSPTHTEDSVTADSPTQSQETSTKQESSTNINKTSTTETQASSTSINSTQPSSEQSLGSDGKSGAAKITGSAEGSYQSRATSYAAVIITPVQMQLNGADLPSDTLSNCSRSGTVNPSASLSSSPSDTSPNSPIGSPELRPSPQCSPLATDPAGHRLTPDRDSSSDNKPPSPVPDGYSTPTFPLASYYYPLLNVPHVPYTGYTAVTIPALQPPLPEKKRLSATAGYLNGHNSLLRVSSAPSPTHHVTFSPAVGQQRRGSALCSQKDEADIRVNAKFVQDSSKYWYKPGISRDQAIAVLKDREPGTFLIRDSNSFQGAYGLALKVATPPPNANITGSKGDPLEQLVRHFLIETGPRGVKIKGCHNESYFGSLSALVYQHSITPISLPYALRIPENDVSDVVGELQEMQSSTSTSTAADLLKQGAACNVLYLNSVETESLTGPEAVSKATKCTLALSPRPVATAVHFKVSSQGITLTDSKRRLFFRRHYPINSVTYSSLDPQDKRWTNSDSTSCKMFGFVARRTGSATENVCHLFAEMDPEQPAVAIVNFINKVMLGPQLRR